MGVIEDFIARYTKEYDFYEQAGRLAAHKLEASLRASGIRAIVTSRAKAVSRLKEKCQNRDRERSYSSVDDIFEDIVDLAGVRVALYFPAERDQVDGAVMRLFNLVSPKKEFPDQSKAQPAKKFPGYSATHYRIQLKEQDLSDSEKRYAAARIEVQVASVLMHAWAEVEHDLAYKPASGELSQDECAILDELNGLVIVGEVMLERLQKAGESRVVYSGKKITNHYDLANHLLSKAKEITDEPVSDSGLGQVDLLFDLVKELNLDTPELLGPYLENLHGNFELRPLAEQIIDSLLAEDPDRYELYRSIRERHSSFRQSGLDSEDAYKQFGIFMTRWLELERLLRELKPSDRPIIPTRRQLEGLPLLDRGIVFEIDQLRRIRNNLVHGIEVPSPAYLAEAAQRLEEIVAEIRRRMKPDEEQ